MARWTDPDRFCALPSCGKVLIRRADEKRYSFLERQTCSSACAHTLQGIKKSASAPMGTRRRKKSGCYEKAVVLPVTDVACANCNYIRESVEYGLHCAPCENGSEFVMRVAGAMRRKTDTAAKCA